MISLARLIASYCDVQMSKIVELFERSWLRSASRYDVYVPLLYALSADRSPNSMSSSPYELVLCSAEYIPASAARALCASTMALDSGMVSFGDVSRMLLQPEATSSSAGTRKRILITR